MVYVTWIKRQYNYKENTKSRPPMVYVTRIKRQYNYKENTK